MTDKITNWTSADDAMTRAAVIETLSTPYVEMALLKGASRGRMEQVIEVTRIHGLMPPEQARKRAVELFRALSLPDPEGIGARYPHQVSGGQLQRLSAAMPGRLNFCPTFKRPGSARPGPATSTARRTVFPPSARFKAFRASSWPPGFQDTASALGPAPVTSSPI